MDGRQHTSARNKGLFGHRPVATCRQRHLGTAGRRVGRYFAQLAQHHTHIHAWGPTGLSFAQPANHGKPQHSTTQHNTHIAAASLASEPRHDTGHAVPATHRTVLARTRRDVRSLFNPHKHTEHGSAAKGGMQTHLLKDGREPLEENSATGRDPQRPALVVCFLAQAA